MGIKDLKKQLQRQEKSNQRISKKFLSHCENPFSQRTKTGKFFKGLGNLANNSLKVADNILTNMEKEDAKSSKPSRNSKKISKPLSNSKNLSKKMKRGKKK